MHHIVHRQPCFVQRSTVYHFHQEGGAVHSHLVTTRHSMAVGFWLLSLTYSTFTIFVASIFLFISVSQFLLHWAWIGKGIDWGTLPSDTSSVESPALGEYKGGLFCIYGMILILYILNILFCRMQLLAGYVCVHDTLIPKAESLN